MQREHVIEGVLRASKQLLDIKLDISDIESILSISQIQTFRKGNIIQRSDEKFSHTGLVLMGMVRSYYLDKDGNEVTKFFHKEFNLFMDEGLIGYKEAISTYEAIENSIVLFMNTEKLKELIQENVKFKDIYIVALESGIRYKIRRENEFLINNATERYLQFEKEYPELIDRVKQSYISTYLGITPESLSRIRKGLKEGEDSCGEICEV